MNAKFTKKMEARIRRWKFWNAIFGQFMRDPWCSYLAEPMRGPAAKRPHCHYAYELGESLSGYYLSLSRVTGTYANPKKPNAWTRRMMRLKATRKRRQLNIRDFARHD